jgi:hypothetical protein
VTGYDRAVTLAKYTLLCVDVPGYVIAFKVGKLDRSHLINYTICFRLRLKRNLIMFTEVALYSKLHVYF